MKTSSGARSSARTRQPRSAAGPASHRSWCTRRTVRGTIGSASSCARSAARGPGGGSSGCACSRRIGSQPWVLRASSAGRSWSSRSGCRLTTSRRCCPAKYFIYQTDVKNQRRLFVCNVKVVSIYECVSIFTPLTSLTNASKSGNQCWYCISKLWTDFEFD